MTYDDILWYYSVESPEQLDSMLYYYCYFHDNYGYSATELEDIIGAYYNYSDYIPEELLDYDSEELYEMASMYELSKDNGVKNYSDLEDFFGKYDDIYDMYGVQYEKSLRPNQSNNFIPFLFVAGCWAIIILGIVIHTHKK